MTKLEKHIEWLTVIPPSSIRSELSQLSKIQKKQPQKYIFLKREFRGYVFKYRQGGELNITYLMPQFSSHGSTCDSTDYSKSVCTVVEDGGYTAYLINSDEELAKVILFFGLKKLPE